MSQIKTVIEILYRTEKSALSQMPRALAGVEMEPGIKSVYWKKLAAVAELERRLNKKATLG